MFLQLGYILHYVKYLTKIHCLRLPKSRTAAEVAHKLLLIFLDFGEPDALQSITTLSYVQISGGLKEKMKGCIPTGIIGSS